MAGRHVVERVQSRTGRRRGQWAASGGARFKVTALTARRPPGSIWLPISRDTAGGGLGFRLHLNCSGRIPLPVDIRAGLTDLDYERR